MAVFAVWRSKRVLSRYLKKSNSISRAYAQWKQKRKKENAHASI